MSTTNTAARDAASVTAAPLNGWQQHVHLEDVWGTTVVIDIRDEHVDTEAAAIAVADVTTFFHDVDAWFSTYRYDTPITLIRNGLWEPSQAPAIVQDVLRACASLRTLTQGAFDPWAVPGGVDPSGYVKGWAADIGVELLAAHGFTNTSINAAGDISVRGCMSPGTPWAVGIRHPEHTHEVIKVVSITDCAIATSGLYERGAHIINPRTLDRTMALESATLIGPDGGMADALATACLIEGLDCVRWFSTLPQWSAYLVSNGTAHFFGPAFQES